MALFRTLLPPTNDPLPSLMVRVCLLFAPDVNFFIDSCQRLRYLYFFSVFLGQIRYLMCLLFLC